jgi:hypothetical protein
VVEGQRARKAGRLGRQGKGSPMQNMKKNWGPPSDVMPFCLLAYLLAGRCCSCLLGCGGGMFWMYFQLSMLAFRAVVFAP